MERKKFVPREWLSVKNKERGSGGEVKIIAPFPRPLPPPSTLTPTKQGRSDKRSRDFKIARTNKTPALQVKSVPHIISSTSCSNPENQRDSV